MANLNQLECLDASIRLKNLQEGSSVQVLNKQLDQHPIEQLRTMVENLDAQRLLRGMQLLRENMLQAVSALLGPYFGLVRLGQDLASNLDRLLEPFQRIQKALASIPPEQLNAFYTWTKRFNENFWRELDEVEKKSFALFGRLGLAGLENCLDYDDFVAILRVHAQEGDGAALDYVFAKFRAEDYRRLNELIEEWNDIPYMAARQKIISSAIAAHKRGEYELSVAALLPLIDGLSAEIADACATPIPKTIKVKHVAMMYNQMEAELSSECLVQIVETVVYQNVDLKHMHAAPASSNRHAILHGRVSDYGNELNSYRVILLLHMTVNIYRRLVPIPVSASGP